MRRQHRHGRGARIGLSAGYPVATGYFFGVGGYNGSTLTSLGVADAFLVRLAP